MLMLMNYYIIGLLLVGFISLTSSFRHLRIPNVRKCIPNIKSQFSGIVSMSLGAVGGKVVVSGIGQVDEDEFFLNLLNEQIVWDPVVLASTDDVVMKKRFLSRTARYSGLLNILNIVNADIFNPEQLSSTLDGANAWIAFNIPRSEIVPLSKAALASNVKRVIFTTELSSAGINETNVPEFIESIQLFQAAGGSFTGIRHGEVIAGDEDFPYEIVNNTMSCSVPVVERGVLERVVAELLQINQSSNIECGVSSSNKFSTAYLHALRSTGLSRRQEVERVLSGGIQRVTRLLTNKYDDIMAKRKAFAEKRKNESEADSEERRQFKRDAEKAYADRKLNEEDDMEEYDFDEIEEEVLRGEPKSITINRRTNEILRTVWNEFRARKYVNEDFSLRDSTSTFYEDNKETARSLAVAELDDELQAMKREKLEAKQRIERMHNLKSSNPKKYAKLLEFEKAELAAQKSISDTWVKYIYLLLEYTLTKAKEMGISFYNMDDASQKMLLRSTANELRKMVNIKDHEGVIYDPADAMFIVARLQDHEIGKKYGIDQPIDDIINNLNSKYANVLKSVPALQRASHIVELAIETLRQEIPAMPPMVAEASVADSLVLQ